MDNKKKKIISEEENLDNDETEEVELDNLEELDESFLNSCDDDKDCTADILDLFNQLDAEVEKLFGKE